MQHKSFLPRHEIRLIVASKRNLVTCIHDLLNLADASRVEEDDRFVCVVTKPQTEAHSR